jgi:hypothetical protein
VCINFTAVDARDRAAKAQTETISSCLTTKFSDSARETIKLDYLTNKHREHNSA